MGHSDHPTLFTIGQTSEICGVSARTLRFYEEHGLILPDKVDEENRYRYYSYDTMRQIQTIRYLLDEGFALSTIQEVLQKDDLYVLKEHFQNQITETEAQIRYQKQRLASLRAWRSLLVEGSYVLEHRDCSIGTRFLEKQLFFHFQHIPQSEEERTEAFIETQYFTESKLRGHTMVDMGGAFTFLYDSTRDRLSGKSEKITLLQTVYPDSESTDKTISFGGFLTVNCYHIGPLSNICDTYERMLHWAREHQFPLQGRCLERHVLDTYSVQSENSFVTEILLPVAGDTAEFEKII